MGALADIWKSERGLLCLVILLTATVLAGIGRMTTDQWISMVQWVFGIYAGSKAITTSVDSLATARKPAVTS